MLQSLAAVTVLVPSYDEGLAFFRDVLGFAVLEDAPLGLNKRWVVVAPSRGAGAALLLAAPSDERQRTRVGDTEAKPATRTVLFWSAICVMRISAPSGPAMCKAICPYG